MLAMRARQPAAAPYGREEDWEDSPPGGPQHPTYG